MNTDAGRFRAHCLYSTRRGKVGGPFRIFIQDTRGQHTTIYERAPAADGRQSAFWAQLYVKGEEKHHESNHRKDWQ